MNNVILKCLTIISIVAGPALATMCSCKTVRPCYKKMLDVLQEQDEAFCIEDAAIGTSTLTVFLQALQQFCSDKNEIRVKSPAVTYDERRLYEVQISLPPSPDAKLPVFVIDAGQEAGTESVRFALYIIEQLIACQENEHMIREVMWVIMPSTNPDGLEYSRYKQNFWKKNLRIDADDVSFGVDISRNFDAHWNLCYKNPPSSFSANYPGTAPATEKETIFIKDVLNRYAPQTKIYLSLRRDGHHIGFPYAYTEAAPNERNANLEFIAAEVANKVNTRSGGVHTFLNDTICELNGKPYCGHSVDYAFDLGIQYSFEMRLFLETDNLIMSKFHSLPRGYDNSLRNGYFSGIRELYAVITNKKKYGKLFEKT